MFRTRVLLARLNLVGALIAGTVSGCAPRDGPCWPAVPMPADTAGWRRIYTADSAISLLVPPTFRADPARAGRYEHGASVWSDGERAVAIVAAIGSGGLSQEPQGAVRRCRVGGPSPASAAIVGRMAEGYGIIAALNDSTVGALSTLLSVAGPQAADTPLALAVLKTAIVGGARSRPDGR